jgi:hypothetical protein
MFRLQAADKNVSTSIIISIKIKVSKLDKFNEF